MFTTPWLHLRRILTVIAALALWPVAVRGDLAGPYTPDAHTLFLFHFDEPAGGSVTANAGSKGGNAYSVNMVTGSTTPATVTTMLGAAGFAGGAVSFGNSFTNPASASPQLGNVIGYDYNNNQAFEGDVSSTTPSPDRLVLTNLNVGHGGQTPFTLEAIIRPTSTAGSQEIICTDNTAYPSNSNTNRGFQFRINSGGLNFQYIGGPSIQAVSGTIPTTGGDKFVPGDWYHVAATYDGTTVRLYWMRRTARHICSTPPG